MIRSFRDKWTERLFHRESVKRIAEPVRRAALRKLLILDAAASLRDLEASPGNRLEKLKGDRKGEHAIRVNAQRRICFRWKDGDPFDVAMVGYH